jgi:hypothetical protein
MLHRPSSRPTSRWPRASSRSSAQDVGEHQRQALRADHALGARRADAGGGQHPLLRADGVRVERQRKAGIARGRMHQRADRGLVRLKQFEAAHQHVEQALARGLVVHVAVIAFEHLAVDVLDVGGEDRHRRAELGAQFGQRHARLGGDVGKSDVLKRMIGEQRQERFDDPVAVAGARCGAAATRLGAFCLAGHDGLLNAGPIGI